MHCVLDCQNLRRKLPSFCDQFIPVIFSTRCIGVKQYWVSRNSCALFICFSPRAEHLVSQYLLWDGSPRFLLQPADSITVSTCTLLYWDRFADVLVTPLFVAYVGFNESSFGLVVFSSNCSDPIFNPLLYLWLPPLGDLPQSATSLKAYHPPKSVELINPKGVIGRTRRSFTRFLKLYFLKTILEASRTTLYLPFVLLNILLPVFSLQQLEIRQPCAKLTLVGNLIFFHSVIPCVPTWRPLAVL